MEQLVLLDPLENLDLLVGEACLDLMDHVGKRDLLVKEGDVETLVLRVILVTLANLAHLDCRVFVDLLEEWVHEEQWVHRENLVKMEEMVKQVSLESKVYLEDLDPWAAQGTKVLWETKDKRGLLECLDQ